VTERPHYVWVDGTIIQQADARVSLLSPTAQYGLSVFEGIRGYVQSDQSGTSLFRLGDHLRRLRSSSEVLDLSYSLEDQVVLEAIRDAVNASELRGDIAVRVTVFVDEPGSWSRRGPTSVFISPVPLQRRDPATKASATACISSWRRIDDASMPPTVKCGANYINSRYAQLEATDRGFDYPILLDRNGQVTESGGSCVMVVRRGTLITPPETSSVLASITRDTLLQLAQRAGIPTEVRPISRTELPVAEEVFLCGSAAEIQPISRIDRHQLPISHPITTALHRAYLDAVTGAVGSDPDWLDAL
jgi:branched-chain amino acid aminotransferase